MVDDGSNWVIILAAGEGQRVRALTVDTDGTPIPKQFCPLEEGTSMLRWTVGRALRLVPAKRVVCVVAEQHRRWWERDLANLPPECVIVQPENRGTAPGILLPLMTVLERDPMARVLVLPSDHYVEHEETLCRAIVAALTGRDRDDKRVTLLGMVPEAFHSGYGWIVPSDAIGPGSIQRVSQFVEKPESHRARRLMSHGALMNSFILIGRGDVMLELYEDAVPSLIETFREAHNLDANRPDSPLHALYRSLPTCDFSREVLERTADRLAVLPVPQCGWTDLGTPARLKLFRSRNHLTPEPTELPLPGAWFG